MTTVLVTPWWRRRSAVGRRAETAGSCAPTPILDWHDPGIRDLVGRAVCAASDEDQVSVLRAVHADIARRVRAVYALEEGSPASRTLARGRGSCSQRLAILEAAARRIGVRTRVRGLLVDGRFWYARFPRTRFAVPDEVLVAWPEFGIGTTWLSPSELFGHSGPTPGSGFTNATGETLFDAVARTAVDWDGVTSPPGTCSACDLSGRVLRDLGRFDSRDELFSRHGQTIGWPARFLAGPVLGRWSAGVASRT